jgi:serine/threonine-protein phosphatase 2B catalytic subunit
MRESISPFVLDGQLTIPRSRSADIANERLPEFEPSGSAMVFPTPSMHFPGRRLSGDLEEMDGGVVERLAERIASGRNPTARPKSLKRYETT